MSTTTPNLLLVKYEITDGIEQNIGTDQPGNMDKIDAHDHIGGTKGLQLTKASLSDAAAANGIATLDASTRLVQNVAATKVVNVPSVRVTHSLDQSTADGVDTPLAFDTERWDTDGIHDPVTNNTRLTCQTAGKYTIVGNVSFASNATGFRQAGIRLNATTFIGLHRVNASSSSVTILPVSTEYNLAIGAFVELLARQTSGGALNVLAAANFSPEFMMVRVGD